MNTDVEVAGEPETVAVAGEIMDLPDFPHYLIWSNEHQMWWGPNHTGYTRWVEEAGRYTLAAAAKQVHESTVGGQLAYDVASYITGYGHRITITSECVVPAPETVLPLATDRQAIGGPHE